MQRSPGQAANALFPEAASANRPIFYRDGRPASVTEVYATLTHGVTTPVQASQPREAGYIEWASQRRTQAREQERMLVDMLLRGPVDPEESGDDGLSRSMFSTDMLRMLSEARENGRRSS